MYAVITSGGKQEKVAVGQQVRVDVLDAEDGSEVTLAPVLLVDGDQVLAGADQLAKASVSARVIGTAKGPKINGFTYKRRTRNRRRFGHRQQYSVLEITAINAR
jgi:large subunit ribosomal protein L21